MADIKSMLKEARKLIDDNKLKEAQELCKNILQKDKKNYLAFVLIGKSLQDDEKASKAFLRAISLKPKHPLAWQGLANYYERQEDIENKAKAIEAYNNILQLEKDEEKVLEIINKVGQLGCLLKNNDSVSIILRYVLDKEHEKYHDAAEKQLLELLRSDVVCKEEDIPSIAVHLKEMLIKDEDDFPTKTLLAKVILQKKDLVKAFIELTELKYFQSNAFREYICRHLCTNFIEHESFFNLDVEQYVYELTRECKDQKYSVLLKSMVLYEKGFCGDAFKQCVRLINYRKADTIVTAFLLKCAFKLKKWQAAEKIAKNFLNTLKDVDFNLSLRKHWFKSLVEQEKWKEALSISKRIPVTSLDENEQAILARCYIENDEDAEDIKKNLQATKHDLQLQALILMKQKKYHDAITLLEQDHDYPLNLFFIGKSYWELQEYYTSFTYFIKAGQKNRDHSYTLLYLGMYFHKIKSDYRTAKRCYERAYELNNIDGNILLNLSDVYIELNLKNRNFTMLYKAYQALYLRYPWICLRLGIFYSNSKVWDQAVYQFQNVIKTEICSATAYECLADAYFGRGAYKSARGMYARTIATDPNRTVHCLTKIGYVQLLLSYYRNAILSFEKVLELDPKAINALKGMARVWLRIAKKKLSNHLYGRARDCAQTAIDYVMKAISLKKKYMCLWSYLAKALMFITSLPDQYIFAYIKLPTTGESEEIVRKEKCDVYQFAFACFSKVAKQKGQTTSYNLALGYFKYYFGTRDITNCQTAFHLAVDCVKLKPRSWKNWNLLGKICFILKRFDIAQHCFLKGLKHITKTTVPKIYCNLGFLYVAVHKYILANHYFSLGQCTMVTYQKSWIGQGLCAEAIREQEAMDLFRHVNCLGNHPEGAIAFSDWMCRVLNIYDRKPTPGALYFVESLCGVALCIDLLVWVTAKRPSNVCASNYLGYLQERSGLLRSALKSYETASQYAGDDKKNIILINIGRVYFKLGEYDKSVKTYKAITEASLDSACGLALALYRKNKYKEAYAAYDTALHWLCNKDEDKAEVLVAMAGIAYRLKGLDSAKTLLFRGVQISKSNPNPYSLFAICSLGFMHSDQSLSTLALRELQRYKKHAQYGAHVIFLKYMCTKYVCKKDKNELKVVLRKCLKYNPRDIELMYYISRCYIHSSMKLRKKARGCTNQATAQSYRKKGKVKAIKTAESYRIKGKVKAIKPAESYQIKGKVKAIKTAESYRIKGKVKAIKAERYVRKALSLARDDYENSKYSGVLFSTAIQANILKGKKSKAFSMAKKSLHLNPWLPAAWRTLMSLMKNRKKLTRKKIMWLMSAARRVSKKRIISRKQIKWFSSLQKRLRRIRRRRW